MDQVVSGDRGMGGEPCGQPAEFGDDVAVRAGDECEYAERGEPVPDEFGDVAGRDVLGDLAVNGFGAALPGVAEQRRCDRLTAIVGRASADGHVGMVGVGLGKGRCERGGPGDEQHRT